VKHLKIYVTNVVQENRTLRSCRRTHRWVFSSSIHSRKKRFSNGNFPFTMATALKSW
jgi:hypothetical protein